MYKFVKIFLIAIFLQISLYARDINLNKYIDTANKTSKHLFVWFHKTDCGYCDRMSEFTLEDDKIAKLIKKKFLFIDINISEKEKITYKKFVGRGRDFAKYIGFDFYPTSLFFDKNGEVIHEATGYRDEKSFHKILKFIELKMYENTEFEMYEDEF